MTTSEIPGLDSLLAGYNSFGTYANTDSSKDPLFVRADLEEYTFQGQSGQLTFLKPTWVDLVRVYATDTWSKTTVTEYEYAKSVSSRTKVEGGYASFKGEVDASFSKDQKQSSSLAYSAYEEIIVTWQLNMPNEDLRGRLTAQAKADIDGTMSPSALFARYGTHYVKSLQVGGKAWRYSTTDTSKYTSDTSIEVAAKASYKNAAGKLSAEEQAKYAESISMFESCSETNADSRGGSTAYADAVFDGKYTEWSASVETNPVLVEFLSEGALVGLWTLATLDARRDEIKAAFDAETARLTCVSYGDEVYLKVQVTDEVWYLTGARGDTKENVYVAESADKDTNFRWLVYQQQNDAGSGVVRYGDVVWLRNRARDDRYLNGARGGVQEDVYTKDPAKEPTKATSYQWRIVKSRTEVGEGPVPYEDTKAGLIFLQCMGYDNRWLTGARSNHDKEVFTKDGEHGAHDDRYTWLMKRKID